MAYRSFDTETWKDPWFEGLSPLAKLLFIYLWTNDTVNQAGIYQVSKRRMEFEVGFKVDEYMTEISEKVYWCGERQIVWVKNFCKRQCANPKFFIGAVKKLGAIPLDLQREFAEYNRVLFEKYGIDTVLIPYMEGKDTVALSGTGTGTGTGTEDKRLMSGKPTSTPAKKCPHGEIISLYHQILPMLPRVNVWGDEKQKVLRARWNANKEYQTLAWWKDYFTFVSESNFLTGQTEKPFSPDLEWLVTKSKFGKILNGRYINRNGNGNKHAGIDEWLKIRQEQVQEATA